MLNQLDTKPRRLTTRIVACLMSIKEHGNNGWGGPGARTSSQWRTIELCIRKGLLHETLPFRLTPAGDAALDEHFGRKTNAAP